MPRTPEESCRLLTSLLTKFTDLDWTFGYLGNDNDRTYYAFAAHPGRVGTHLDRIGGVQNPSDLIPQLQGAVALAVVQNHRKKEYRYVATY